MIIYRQTTKQILIDEKKIKKRGAGRDTYFDYFVPLEPNDSNKLYFYVFTIKKKRSPNGRLINLFAKICIICHKKMIELYTQIL